MPCSKWFDKRYDGAIEDQVERFAPGFKETILARHTMNSQQMQTYNPNYIGGDINGGVIDIRQLFTRPALRSRPIGLRQKVFIFAHPQHLQEEEFMECVAITLRNGHWMTFLK